MRGLDAAYLYLSAVGAIGSLRNTHLGVCVPTAYTRHSCCPGQALLLS
jgi:hypothetical protein